MNIIAFIILIALIIDFSLHTLADVLNLKMLSCEVPESFSDIYDKERYSKSQEYLKTNTKFGWIASISDMIILFAFWFGKGFYYLDYFIRSFHFGPILSGLIYMGTLLLFKAILSLPFDIYSTFVIEEKFGFNKTDIKTFIQDRIKGLIISILIGVPLLALILAFLEYTGPHAWLYCWIIITLFMLLLNFIVPTWIMPFFNKFKPLEDGPLKNAINDYARSIDFSLENIFVMDGSKRSSKSNAFFTGFGKHKRIVLFDTLINSHTVPELVSVLAHEMGHYKKKHILKSMFFGILQAGIILFILSLFISYDPLFAAFYIDQKSVYTGLIFFSMLYAPIDFFIEIFIQMYSRKNEYEADLFAVKTIENPNSLADALKKLASNNLSNLLPHPLYVFLNYSHPPVLERIRTIKNCSK